MTSQDEPHHRVPYLQLFRFATTFEKLLFWFGILCAICSGVLSPLVNNAFGNFIETLLEIDEKYCKPVVSGNVKRKCSITNAQLITSLQPVVQQMITICICQFIVSYLYCVCLKYVSEQQLFRTKNLFFEHLVRQDIGWHDVQTNADHTSRVRQNSLKIQSATGDNLGYCISLVTSSIVAVLNAFYHGPYLTAVSLFMMPFAILVIYWGEVLAAKFFEEQSRSYESAGEVASEALGSIRTVVAFGGETKEMNRYNDELRGALRSGIKRGLAMGMCDGLNWLAFYLTTAFTLWMGTCSVMSPNNKEPDGQCDPEVVLIVYMCLMMAASDFGEGISYFEFFSEGRIAAYSFHSVIDRVSSIDPLSNEGLTPEQSLKGNIEIKDLHFAYPMRKNAPILQGVNISIKAGQTVAFVGGSGSGKSTIMQLLQRLYDPDQGTITVDGYDIRVLNVSWYRSQMRTVRQEPTLFSGTIYDNIRLGKIDATDEEIQEVCKVANAHDFISAFSKGYETMVGERVGVSGGQKQRIAIARTLISDPPILLLDEATSGLDVDAERAIHASLDIARRGRTTIIVAHRMSTIIYSDLIVYLKEGQVLERGTHEQLLQKKGAYHALWTTHNKALKDSKPSSPSLKVKEVSIPLEIVGSSSDGSNPTIEEEEAVEEEVTLSRFSLLKIWILNRPEWGFILLGILTSVVGGSIHVFHGLLFGNVVETWSLPPDDKGAYSGGLLFIMLAVAAGGAAFLRTFSFTVSGEGLTFRLRVKIFESMIFQDIGWFDDKKNHVGALCTRLAEDAALVQAITGSRMGNIVQGATSIIISSAISAYYSFKLGILGLVSILCLNCVAFLEEQYLSDELEQDVTFGEKGAVLVLQAASQARTIASLNIEGKLMQEYEKLLIESLTLNLKPLHIRGFIMGISMAFTWLAYIALASFASYIMVTEGTLGVPDIVAVSQFVIFGTQVVAEAMASSPNYYKAKLASGRVLRLLDMRPMIKRNEGMKLNPDEIEGKLDFHKVFFAYPERTDDHTLNSVTFHCDAGKHMTMVGPSGCGKSTCLSLILRYYEPTSGEIRLDGQKLTEIDVDSLRSLIAVVTQEPVLFNRTIAENIAYGDNGRDDIPIEEIHFAAKNAEIHEFIMSLPEGYETTVGQLGELLSGGQKQRIAIARALIRNAKMKILLLDEATSALDAQSEDAVQTTLDNISQGKTSIAVSHHTAALRHADIILVFNESGKIAEQGDPEELMETSTYFQHLVGR